MKNTPSLDRHNKPRCRLARPDGIWAFKRLKHRATMAESAGIDTLKRTMAELASNRRAQFDYEIIESYEAGIELHGHEVKSIRLGRMQLSGSFVHLRGGEAWLANTLIPPYQAANTPAGYDPARPRRLLLHRRELKELTGKSSQKGLTLVALRVYSKGPVIKVAFGLARRKKAHDKRERIREREDARSIERAFRENRG